MCQVLVQVLNNLNSFVMEFCEMGVLYYHFRNETALSPDQSLPEVTGCLRVEEARTTPTAPARHGPRALALLAE